MEKIKSLFETKSKIGMDFFRWVQYFCGGDNLNEMKQSVDY